MDFFADRAHLRLRSRAHGTYLHAMEDGVGITLRQRRGTLNEAWAVHRVERGGTNYVLLHGAAYGRYLALIREEAPAPSTSSSGQGDQEGAGAGRARHTCRAAQRVYDGPGQDDVLWDVLAADDGSGDVLMRHRRFGDWRNHDDQRRAMQWRVKAVPAREDPPELPPVVPPPAVPVGGPIRRRRRAVQPPAALRRTIHYVRADGQGNFSPLVWRMLQFEGRSVTRLRRDLAEQLPGVGEANVLSITLCVRAGSNGRLTPLVVDLPSSEQAMDIVVLATDSPALVHPNVGAP